jgi:hypothetical protein
MGLPIFGLVSSAFRRPKARGNLASPATLNPGKVGPAVSRSLEN